MKPISEVLERIQPYQNIVPLFKSTHFADSKDPCPVYDGKRWHIFGSGGSVSREEWQLIHATAEFIEGPWQEEEPVILRGLSGPHVAAPGVVYDETDQLFHMFIQSDFLALDGTVEYLTSPDGKVFTCQDSVLQSLARTGEAGIYDPHPAVLGDRKLLVYSGTPVVERHETGRFIAKPDLYLAESTSGHWRGPWERRGKILDHTEIAWHHNQINEAETYEWGVEGAQIVPLPRGHVLLNATCFLPHGTFGSRQRVFFAVAESVTGPYHSIGPIISVLPAGSVGENGHATAIGFGSTLYLFYQARAFAETAGRLDANWHYGAALFDVGNLEDVLAEYLKSDKAGYDYSLYRSV